jgi:hypothetical protein
MNMSNPTGPDEAPLSFGTPDPAQQHKSHEGEKDPDEEGTLLKEEDEKGMDMGTTFEVDKEQDLDDLIHNQAALKSSTFPRPDEV